tara:strand:+ start:164 stop:517 length:354 start_codon:yes stop_codon:yes gene_type:complete
MSHLGYINEQHFGRFGNQILKSYIDTITIITEVVESGRFITTKMLEDETNYPLLSESSIDLTKASDTHSRFVLIAKSMIYERQTQIKTNEGSSYSPDEDLRPETSRIQPAAANREAV